jgi:hypothetical protein
MFLIYHAAKCDRVVFPLVLLGSVLTVLQDDAEVYFIMVSQVGDFGLARWQPDGDMGVETRVIGTFG